MCPAAENMHNTGYCVFFYAFINFIPYLVNVCRHTSVQQAEFSITESRKQDCGLMLFVL